MPGLFIVLEGVEGSGKSTQARLLAEWLGARGVPHLLTREPGGTTVGEAVRNLVLHQPVEMPARAELLLYLAARAVFVEQVVRPALAEGRVVVSDRFALSTLAYQGYGRGLDVDEVLRLNQFATGGLEPDLTLLLEVDVREGAERRAAAGRAPDRIERAGDAFHERVAGAYGLLASQEGRVERVDGRGAPEAVCARILARLQAAFPETFPEAAG